jgi:ABC-type sugar transport system ATPase subunit
MKPLQDRVDCDVHNPVLQMNQVSKRYPGMLAVDSVSLDIIAGEVHALLGENGAGKSTLMKMLAGSFNDYTGEIYIEGKKVNLHTPSMAKENGIAMIYQELSLAAPLSIADNILVGRLPKKMGFLIDSKKLQSETQKCLAKVGLDLDIHKPVSQLSPHEAQLVEIAKALGNNPRILVMDEPTSSLSHKEVERLFTIIEDLKKQGLAIIYISHHLPEIFRIADRVSVMRDGVKVFTSTIGEVTNEKLVQGMVGKKIDAFYHRKTQKQREVRFKVNGLNRYGFFKDISFEARKGEILGVAGLAGSGRTEIMRAISGIDPIDKGNLELDGKKFKPVSLQASMDLGICYLTEDRKKQGLFLRLDIKENILSTLIKRHTKGIIYSSHIGEKIPDSMIKKLEIMPSDESAQVSNLSGGNQQKILLAKCLAIEPKLLILDEPTRGVDIGAKQLIHETIIELARETGTTILLISADLPELVHLSDRCIVIKDGQLIHEMKKEELNEEDILLRANGE